VSDRQLNYQTTEEHETGVFV